MAGQAKDIWTIKKILEWTISYFGKYTIPTPRLDAELLLAHTLNTNRLALYLDMLRPLSNDELSSYKEMIKRRVASEPVAYITEKKEFWSLEFKVNRSVLIPRPDTEVLVEHAISFIKKKNMSGITNILDIGTGSGNIPVSIAKEIEGAMIVATDLSKDALNIAAFNAVRHNVAEKINFVCGNMLDNFRKNSFDLITSNPPYIPSKDIQGLSPDIVNYEPYGALDGGEDGLKYIEILIRDFTQYIKRGGGLIIEIGDTQAALVLKLLTKYHKEDYTATVIKDYSKRDRAVLIPESCAKTHLSPMTGIFFKS